MQIWSSIVFWQAVLLYNGRKHRPVTWHRGKTCFAQLLHARYTGRAPISYPVSNIPDKEPIRPDLLCLEGSPAIAVHPVEEACPCSKRPSLVTPEHWWLYASLTKPCTTNGTHVELSQHIPLVI